MISLNKKTKYSELAEKASISVLIYLIHLVFWNEVSAQEYFQQEVNYKIDVRLDDENHSLHAFESMEYTNNSNDNLDSIYFHVWPNAYKNNETALGGQLLAAAGKRKFMNSIAQAGYIDSLDFNVDGHTVKWEINNEHIDICVLILNQSIAPGETITITTPFRVKLPSGTLSRLGHIGQSYRITQWYPKPAVYDHKGWHPMYYLDAGEFYSEYGSFEVSITLPNNYIVAATGNLQNEEELEFLNQKALETAKIESFDQSKRDTPESDSVYKTLTFTESNIHDFAWFADKRLHVLKSEVELPNSGRKVSTWLYFPNHNAELWKNAIPYINDAVYYYSLWYGDYPYNNCSAVHMPRSSGGMEYPTVTIIGESATPRQLEITLVHEVGHNWFYGILGSNERDHPWMDEGLNTLSEIRYFNTKYPDNRLYPFQFEEESAAKFFGIENLRYAYLHEMLYRVQARRNLDLPTNASSEELVGLNYSAMAYSKTGLAYYHLEEYLGEDKFNKIMQSYYEKWKFKHPYPEDLQAEFEKEVDEDLSWFFDDIMSSNKKLDYKTVAIRKDKVKLKNNGKVEAPVKVNMFSGDSLIFSKWVEGFRGSKWVDIERPDGKSLIELHGHAGTDINPNNDRIRQQGLLRKNEKLRMQLIGIVENPEKTTINVLPAFAWNHHNNFMSGVYIYRDFLPLSKFEYQIMPLYAFGSEDLAGMAELRYNAHTHKSLFQRISPFINGKQFAYGNSSGAYYQRLNPGIDFRFKRKINNRPVDNDIRLEYLLVTDIEKLEAQNSSDLQGFYKVRYEKRNAERIYPYSFNISSHGNETFAKLDLELNYKHTYIYKNSLDIRFFAGGFLYRENNLPAIYNYYSSGTIGLNDYTFSGLYLGRSLNPNNSEFISNQFQFDQGGFISFNPNLNSREYLISLNLSSSLPVAKNIPVQAFVNTAYLGTGDILVGTKKSDPFQYEVGLKLQVVRNIFEIYFPLYSSDDISEYQDAVTKNYVERIRFTLDFSKLNIPKLARELK